MFVDIVRDKIKSAESLDIAQVMQVIDALD